MARSRMIDPSASARSFVARRGGMRDNRSLDRRIQKIESRVSPAREDIISPEEWSLVEEVEETPEVDEDIVGRFFLVRNVDSDDVFAAGLTAADGSPILVGLSTTPAATGDQALSLATLFDLGAIEPRFVSVSPSGEYYLTQLGTNYHIIRRYDANGIALSSVTVGAASDVVISVVHDSLGNWYALNAVGGSFTVVQLKKYNSSNVLQATYLPVYLAAPFAMAVNESDVIYIADEGRLEIVSYTTLGVFISAFPVTATPNAISIGVDGNIFVGEGDDMVRKYSPTGTLLLEFGGNGIVAGQFNTISAITTLSDGSIIAIDATGRVQAFDEDGDFLSFVGSYGSDEDELRGAIHAITDAFDNVIIADRENNRLAVSRFTAIGDASQYPMQDDFIGGNATSGTIGELGWTTNGSGSLSVASSTAAHPGIISLATGATSGNTRNVYLGPWLLPNIRRQSFYFKPGPTLTNSTIVVGIGSGVTSTDNQYTDGVMVRSIDGANFRAISWQFSGTMDNVDLGMAPVADAWYQVIFERTADQEVTVTLRRMSTGVTVQAVVTGVPNTIGLNAHARIRTTNAATKTLEVDFWSGDVSGVTRV